MRIHEIYENTATMNAMMPRDYNEFLRLWNQLRSEADDPDDKQFYNNDVIKNEVHAILQRSGYRLSLGKAESEYRKNQEKKAPAANRSSSQPSDTKPKKPVPGRPSQSKPSSRKNRVTAPEVQRKAKEVKGKIAKAIARGVDIADKYTKYTKK